MKRKLTLLVAGLWAATLLNAQSLEWARSFGSEADDVGTAISVDASGNVYSTGYFALTADFDPGAGTTELTSVGERDVYVQKMDASGNFLWARSFGTDDSDRGLAIGVDAMGHVYTTGYFEGTADFDPGPGTFDLTSAGQRDIFVQKMDASGNFLWARAFGGDEDDEGVAIGVDSAGHVYTVGFFRSTGDFDPGAGTTELTSAGNRDIFVQKMDASGNFLWAKAIGGSDRDEGNGISLDASGHIYITGYFRGSVDFDPGAGTTSITSNGSSDVFVQKLDAAGNFLWVRSFGGSDDDRGLAVKVDNVGYVHTTGFFAETVDFDPGAGTTNLTSTDGSRDIFVQKLDTSGNFRWAIVFGGDNADQGTSISVDASGQVFTTGDFQGTADFDPGAGTAELTSVGSDDIFVQGLDSSGNFLWANTFGSDAFETGNAVEVDASGNVYVTGFFRNTVDFDPGAGTTDLASVGQEDIFVLSLSSGTTGIIDLGGGIRASAYPNPTQGWIQLSFEAPQPQVVVTLHDMHGKAIYSQTLREVASTPLAIDAPAGIYFLRIETPHGQRVVKLIRE